MCVMCAWMLSIFDILKGLVEPVYIKLNCKGGIINEGVVANSYTFAWGSKL